uniref:Somatostatin receptor type 3-like n=1 Tax=Saccoglossus kowalevskii TaxID=10224 RepID=A0ABM0LW85_SACKO|nr:PREDICTED: somatostatin receptor type 3-like [Saccoglossus kowalevskii]
MVLASPPLAGWSVYSYLPGQSFCFCSWKSSESYTFFMVGVCFGGPCSVMAFCYVQIMREVRRSRRRISSEDPSSDDDIQLKVSTIAGAVYSHKISIAQRKRRQRRHEEDVKLTFSFLVVITLFVISWMPFCATMFWSIYSSTPVPRPIDMATLLLGYFNSCCNPIVYGLMNKRYRWGYKRLFKNC